jgi:hypothetical protein
MVNFVPLVETIRDERAKHALLLVDAVEERTNMTMLAESTRVKLLGLRGGVHILTFTQKSVVVRRTGWCRPIPSRTSLSHNRAL